MYKGLGLYICRNLMEIYKPGRDYILSLIPDDKFENFSCLTTSSEEKTFKSKAF